MQPFTSDMLLYSHSALIFYIILNHSLFDQYSSSALLINMYLSFVLFIVITGKIIGIFLSSSFMCYWFLAADQTVKSEFSNNSGIKSALV